MLRIGSRGFLLNYLECFDCEIRNDAENKSPETGDCVTHECSSIATEGNININFKITCEHMYEPPFLTLSEPDDGPV